MFSQTMVEPRDRSAQDASPRQAHAGKTRVSPSALEPVTCVTSCRGRLAALIHEYGNVPALGQTNDAFAMLGDIVSRQFLSSFFSPRLRKNKMHTRTFRDFAWLF
jgi:hypothetical protein